MTNLVFLDSDQGWGPFSYLHFPHQSSHFQRRIQKSRCRSWCTRLYGRGKNRRLVLTGRLDCCDWLVNNILPKSHLPKYKVAGGKIYLKKTKSQPESKFIFSFPLRPPFLLSRWWLGLFNLVLDDNTISASIQYNCLLLYPAINGKQFYIFPIVLTIRWDCQKISGWQKLCERMGTALAERADLLERKDPQRTLFCQHIDNHKFPVFTQLKKTNNVWSRKFENTRSLRKCRRKIYWNIYIIKEIRRFCRWQDFYLQKPSDFKFDQMGIILNIIFVEEWKAEKSAKKTKLSLFSCPGSSLPTLGRCYSLDLDTNTKSDFIRDLRPFKYLHRVMSRQKESSI